MSLFRRKGSSAADLSEVVKATQAITEKVREVASLGPKMHLITMTPEGRAYLAKSVQEFEPLADAIAEAHSALQEAMDVLRAAQGRVRA